MAPRTRKHRIEAQLPDGIHEEILRIAGVEKRTRGQTLELLLKAGILAFRRTGRLCEENDNVIRRRRAADFDRRGLRLAEDAPVVAAGEAPAG